MADVELKFYEKGLRFECTGCGDCCRARNGRPSWVYVTLDERHRLARHLGMTTSAFTRRYCGKTLGFHHLRNPTDDCVFLDGGRCSVYAARPALDPRGDRGPARRRSEAGQPVLTALLLAAASVGVVGAKPWIHGAADCATNRDPPIDVLEVDADTFILRQSKCVHAEAPFIYVLVGRDRVLVLDTGATADAARFPLYATVRKLAGTRQHLPLLVAHTHSHGDHTAGDGQFRGQAGVTLVEPNGDAVRAQFGFDRWPDGQAHLDLGGRELVVMPIPGHQDESIAIFDTRTGWLLTGDTVYPGRLYVWDWDEYRASIRKLAAFADAQTVTAIMGTHVEISRAGELFAVGATHQPDEMPLPLSVRDLAALDARLAQAPDATALQLQKFAVVPFGWFPKTVITIRKWLRLD